MKAVILNSGVGSRMGELTRHAPKCFAPLDDGTCILDRQLRQLLTNNIRDIVITTGPFEGMIEQRVTRKFPDAHVTYICNPQYAVTNYIYSLYLAREVLHGPLLLLHGDLVFEQSVLNRVLQSERSVMVCDTLLPLPQKDFKAVVHNGRIEKIGIQYFEDACAAQPLYKLNDADWAVWQREITRFCERGERGVYAENAFNEVSGQCVLYALDVQGALCAEADTPEDLCRLQGALKKSGETI